MRDRHLRGRGGRHGDGAGDAIAEAAGGNRRACSRTRPLVSDRPENVATPFDAVAVSVPPRVAPPGLFASATVTVPSKDVIRLPELSSASTVRPKRLPAATLAGGCLVTTSCDEARVATPIAFASGSVNQMLPSGPAVIANGPAPE